MHARTLLQKDLRLETYQRPRLYKNILLESNAHRVQNRPSDIPRTSSIPFRLISEVLGMRVVELRPNRRKTMADDLIAKKNENKYDAAEDLRGSKVQNENDSIMHKVSEDGNGMLMDGE